MNIDLEKEFKFKKYENSNIFSDYRFYNDNDLFSDEFIEYFKNKVNWCYICRFQKHSEEFFIKYFKYVKCYWDQISQYQTLSESFMETYKDKIVWQKVSHFQSLSESFIEKHKDKVNWNLIFKYQSLSESFKEKYKDYLK